MDDTGTPVHFPSAAVNDKREAAADRVLGFIDVGSNSIRLMIVSLQPNHSYSIVREEKEAVRLGKTGAADHGLEPEAMDRAIIVCRKFRELAEAFGAAEIHAAATSATREAPNQGEFLQRLRREAGLNVRVISGREEARLIYLGVAGGAAIDSRTALFIDIGGGSTEIIIGTQHTYQYLDSLGLGAIRLTTMFLADGGRDPVTPEIYTGMKRHVKSKVLRNAGRSRKTGIDMAWGSSGTIINLAEIAARLCGRPVDRRGLTLKLKDLRRVMEFLCTRPLAERQKAPGINPERADILIAGGAIIETIMEEFQLKKMYISDRAMRHGMLIDYLERRNMLPQLQELSTREMSVLRLGRSCGIDEEHAGIITTLALQLFDSARDLGLHTAGTAERELLTRAAFLHDIGNFISFRGHHLHSHYIISNAELLGFDQTEVAIIAAIARYHRKKLPRRKSRTLQNLDAAGQQTVITLSMLLRLAEKLDRGHTGHIVGATFTGTDNGEVVLSLDATGKCELEIWGVTSYAGDFRQVFGKSLRLDLKKTPLTGTGPI
ncbi:MAG: Ppx/GppA family phosphatase [Deltaproteobacteria bacterium]|nr:Ppx/GppA family phosphatase [Candidatus Anaeroferrophillacea bacterium]